MVDQLHNYKSRRVTISSAATDLKSLFKSKEVVMLIIKVCSDLDRDCAGYITWTQIHFFLGYFFIRR